MSKLQVQVVCSSLLRFSEDETRSAQERNEASRLLTFLRGVIEKNRNQAEKEFRNVW